MSHTIRWTIPKLTRYLKIVEAKAYRASQPLPDFQYTPLESPSVNEWPEDGDVVPADSYWANLGQDFVLRSSFQTDWDNAALYLPLGEAGNFSHPEALVYIDDEIYMACDRHHQELPLPSRFCDGTIHQLTLHGWTGLPAELLDKSPGESLLMRTCQIVQIDEPTREFANFVRVALEVVQVLDDNTPDRHHLLNSLDAAFRALDLREPLADTFYASVPEALQILKEGIHGNPMPVDVFSVGHAHIDVAWLWTLAQTRRKAGRTFANVLKLMEHNEDFKFTQSQPQLYDYIRKDYPTLFEQIKQRIVDQRWEPIGGMWVEADCNLSGSEALARQFVLGRQFFREHFGSEAESPILWLPDVFGYAWNLPQIMRLAGIEYFFTIKIGWNQYNRLPYDSFWWQGLDGTRILTHFSPTLESAESNRATYNAAATPFQVMSSWTNFQQKSEQQAVLMSYGYGDGGGGPTREMIENITLLDEFPSMPRTKMAFAREFFERMASDNPEQLPVWFGELYLEYHRGTYTTQARNKRANRKSEFSLHDVEFLATYAHLLDSTYAYPQATLTRIWQIVCLNQFHDIIPGSSITQVYEDSLAQYAEITSELAHLRNQALNILGNQIGGDVMVINPTSFDQNQLVEWDGQLESGQSFILPNGNAIATQAIESGTLLQIPSIEAYSVLSLTRGANAETTTDTNLTATADTLENDFVRVRLNEFGDITSLYDKQHNRELIPAGTVANQMQAFRDRPMQWDAWDIDIYYDEQRWLVESPAEISVVETGPLRVTLEIKKNILSSIITQRISLCAHSSLLEFDTHVDWHEQHILLKAAFPLEIHSDKARFDIQWGSVERPTHRNTSWDWARFETCAHKWIDLSEGDYGVSLLNDCKYGHDVHQNVMRLSLLRGTTYPDPHADQGKHQFSYALLPHAGDWRGETLRQAYHFNDPLIAVSSNQTANPAASSLVASDRDAVIVETIKQAEDGNGVVVRLYEAHQTRGWVTLTTNFAVASATEVNLLEEHIQALELDDGHNLRVFIKPFEIKTLRLIPQT